MSGLYFIHIFNFINFMYDNSTLSFYLGLTSCSSTNNSLPPTIVLEYSSGGGPFINLQELIVNGTYNMLLNGLLIIL